MEVDVNELVVMAQVVFGVALVVVPTLVLVRFIAGGGEGGGIHAFLVYRDLPWPRGVQEEDPPRWRLELLEPRRGTDSQRARSGPGAPDPRHLRPHPAPTGG
jgi:hypothetical protein